VKKNGNAERPKGALLPSSSRKGIRGLFAGRLRFGLKDGVNWLLENSRNVEGKRQAGIVLPVLNGVHGLP